MISRLAGKSPAPTDAKRSLRDHQAPGDGSLLAYQPVACHPLGKVRTTVPPSQGSPGIKNQAKSRTQHRPNTVKWNSLSRGSLFPSRWEIAHPSPCK